MGVVNDGLQRLDHHPVSVDQMLIRDMYGVE
jgi:hypothetical protein